MSGDFMFVENVCRNLVSSGLLTESEYISLRGMSAQDNFLENVLKQGLSFQTLSAFLEDAYRIPTCDLRNADLSREIVDQLPHQVAQKYGVLPITITSDEVLLAMSNPFDLEARNDVQFILKRHVRYTFANPEDIKNHINELYRKEQFNLIVSQFDQENGKYNLSVGTQKENQDIQNAPAVKLMDTMIKAALSMEASDIHIEPFEKVVRTRFRLDGKLIDFQSVDIGYLQYMIARLKVISKLDTADRRLPQDGHIAKGIYDDRVDFRISIMPCLHGEKAVIRLIYSKHSHANKNALGFFEEDMPSITRMFNNNYGAVLVTGPTGSGKTTTLVAFLNELNKIDVNVVTIEDPVENVIHGVNQININPKIGLDFAATLRSILRQDPDVIMVGEIRDTETANIAISAAISGHLVLSTIHTNDALGTVVRLMDMGVSGYLVAAAIKGIISQRLMRKLCPHCKKHVQISQSHARVLNVPEDTFLYEQVGCNLCNHTGYKGRFAVYEYILMDEELRGMIASGVSQQEIKSHLNKKGMVKIWDNALRNVLMGHSTVAEMFSAVFEF